MSSKNKSVLLIYGLPGSGKTTLSEYVVKNLKLKGIPYVWFNADKVRSTLSSDLGFSSEDRIEQARRMGCLASLALDGSDAQVALVDFVNPTVNSYKTFQENLRLPIGNRKSDATESIKSFESQVDYPLVSVWMNTIKTSRFEDTNLLFTDERPATIQQNGYLEGSSDFENLASHIVNCVFPFIKG